MLIYRLVRMTALLIGFLGTGCDGLFEPNDRRVVGVLEVEAMPPDLYAFSQVSETESCGPERPYCLGMGHPRLDAPDTVLVGVSFEIVIRTFGTGGDRKGGADVTSSAETVTVAPWDFMGRGGMDSMYQLPRSAEIVFMSPGEGRLRVVGRRLHHANGAVAYEPVVIERTIYVVNPE